MGWGLFVGTLRPRSVGRFDAVGSKERSLTPYHQPYPEDGYKDGPLAPPHAYGPLRYSRYLRGHDGPLRHVHALVSQALPFDPESLYHNAA